MRYVFTTKLTPTECIENIKVNSHEGSFLNQLSTIYDYDKELFYTVTGHSFRLEKVIRYRNSFKPYFHGKVYAAKSGSRIEGEFNMHFFVKCFMVIWFAGIICMSGVMIGKGLIDATSNQNVFGSLGISLGGLLTALGFCGFGVGIILLGKFLGKKDEDAMINFIEKACKATRISR